MQKLLFVIVIFLSACATKQPPSNEELKPSVEDDYQRALNYYHQNELNQALQTAENSLKTYPNLLTVEKVSSGRNLKFRGTNGFSLFPPPHKK